MTSQKVYLNFKKTAKIKINSKANIEFCYNSIQQLTSTIWKITQLEYKKDFKMFIKTFKIIKKPIHK